jgi:prolycopene isomerase
MGTGTPTVTTSGITAANVLLKKLKKKPYVYKAGMKNFVRLVDKPFSSDQLYLDCKEKERTLMRQAIRCRI